MCTHTQQINTYWSTVHWGVGGGRGVSVGGVSQLRPLNVNHCPLLPESDINKRSCDKSCDCYSIPTSELLESKLANTIDIKEKDTVMIEC